MGAGRYRLVCALFWSCNQEYSCIHVYNQALFKSNKRTLHTENTHRFNFNRLFFWFGVEFCIAQWRRCLFFIVQGMLCSFMNGASPLPLNKRNFCIFTGLSWVRRYLTIWRLHTYLKNLTKGCCFVLCSRMFRVVLCSRMFRVKDSQTLEHWNKGALLENYYNNDFI